MPRYKLYKLTEKGIDDLKRLTKQVAEKVKLNKNQGILDELANCNWSNSDHINQKALQTISAVDRNTIRKVLERNGGARKDSIQDLFDGCMLYLCPDLSDKIMREQYDLIQFDQDIHVEICNAEDMSLHLGEYYIDEEGSEEHIYLERTLSEKSRQTLEEVCLNEILNSEKLIRIKGTQGTGKTRLWQYLSEKKLDKTKFKVVPVTFRSLGISLLMEDNKEHYDVLLSRICENVNYELSLPANIFNDHWSKNGDSHHKLMMYLEKIALKRFKEKVILIFDDFDLLFEKRKFADNLCGLLAGWYDKSRPSCWTKLIMFVLHATEMYGEFDINNSPLANRSNSYNLPDFTRELVFDLIQKLNLQLTDSEVEQLVEEFDGNPSIIMKFLNTLKKPHLNLSFEEVMEQASIGTGIFRSHFNKLNHILDEYEDLKLGFIDVLTGKSIDVRLATFHKLEGMGLVKISICGTKVEVKCPLYKKYYIDYLLSENYSNY